MSKIAIITWHSIPNHGAMLQMYGLSKIFHQMGYDTEFVLHKIETDYKFSNNNSQKSRLQKLFSREAWRVHINHKKSKAYNEMKHSVMLSFQDQSFDTNEEVASDVIACCIGSDEVFGLVNNFTPLFFGENIQCPVFSYAGSFGQTTEQMIEIRGIRERLSQDFNRFSAISVRDENSKRLVNYLGNNAEIHIDPVLLYGFKEELSNFSKEVEERILIYAYDANMNSVSETRAIRKISKINNGIPIISAGFSHIWCDDCIQATPLEMIGEFAKSKYIITDTFHGAVISIITHSRFVVKVRNTLNANKLIFLLEMLGLKDRIAYDDSQFESILKTEIDYDSVELKLASFRKESLSYLKNVMRRIEQNGSV